MTSRRNPKLYIVCGSNGAGKTTFATKFFPNYIECMEFVNADLIAIALSPFSPDRAAFRAGRLMIEQIHLLAKRHLDFCFETTLAEKGYVRLFHNLKDCGYLIHLFFLWVCDVDIALKIFGARHQMPYKYLNLL